MPTTASPLKLKRRRINFRMIIFAIVVLGLLGYPAYIYFNSVLSGGIERSGNYLKVDLKAMGDYPFPTDGSIADVPTKWQALNGKEVMLMGEVWAPNEAGDHMTKFELVYSIAKCCFGGPPKVQERVFAHVPEKMRVPNLTYSFANVWGKLSVDVIKDHGVVTSVYNLHVNKIQPLQ